MTHAVQVRPRPASTSPDVLRIEVLMENAIIEAGLTACLSAASGVLASTGALPKPDIVVVDPYLTHGPHVQRVRRLRPVPCVVGLYPERVPRDRRHPAHPPLEVRTWVPLSLPAPALVELLRSAWTEHREEAPAAAYDDVLVPALTPRESEILTLICAGHTNAAIAAELFLSINSIKTHIRGLYRKIGVTRRSQAVAWGLHLGY